MKKNFNRMLLNRPEHLNECLNIQEGKGQKAEVFE